MKYREIRWDVILTIILSLALCVSVVYNTEKQKRISEQKNIILEDINPEDDTYLLSKIVGLIDDKYPKISLVRIYVRDDTTVYEVTYQGLTSKTYKKKDVDRETVVISLASDLKSISPEQKINVDVLDITELEVVLLTASDEKIEWSVKHIKNQ